ncbi:hypothetical protein JCM10207_009113 [Rhodosporidiobolus poonsookiae]
MSDFAFAKTNFSKSGASGLYDRARPSYPAEAISHLLSTLPTTSATVVELGAGTGLFTRAFLSAATSSSSPTQAKVGKLVAVEPSEGMREGFAKGIRGMDGFVPAALGGEGLLGSVGGVEVWIKDGAFESVPEADASADLLVIAQAFHWSGRGNVAAVEEIARVLKPGATWAKIWNLEDRDTAWVQQLRDLYEEFEAGTPQYRLGLWKSIWDLPSFPRLFTSPESHLTYTQLLPTTDDLVVDRVFSKSYITALSDAQRGELEGKLREVVRRGEGRKWIREDEGVFEYPYKTDLFVTKRK